MSGNRLYSTTVTLERPTHIRGESFRMSHQDISTQPAPGRTERVLRWATTTLKAIMIAMAILAVYSGPIVWIYSGIFCTVFAFMPTIVFRYTGLSLPVALEFLLFLSLFLHVGGGALGIYSMWGSWDIVTHFVSAFMLALVGITVVFLANEYWNFMVLTPARVVLVTMVIAMSLGFIWEGMEWTADKLFAIRAQDGAADTVLDLVMDAVGGLAAALLAVRWVGNGTLTRMTTDISKVISGDRTITDPVPLPH